LYSCIHWRQIIKLNFPTSLFWSVTWMDAGHFIFSGEVHLFYSSFNLRNVHKCTCIYTYLNNSKMKTLPTLLYCLWELRYWSIWNSAIFVQVCDPKPHTPRYYYIARDLFKWSPMKDERRKKGWVGRILVWETTGRKLMVKLKRIGLDLGTW
jgi:hypothetical protein